MTVSRAEEPAQLGCKCGTFDKSAVMLLGAYGSALSGVGDYAGLYRTLGLGMTTLLNARVEAVTPLAYVALGSNLNGPLAQLRQARRGLGELGELMGCSSLWRTTPVGGPLGQADFLNAVAVMRPRTDDPEGFLEHLLSLEAAQGRTRNVRWDARTLDLDLLSWGTLALHKPELTLPHPRMLTRAFVLAPLCEVAPEWRHPLSSQRACEVLKTLPPDGIKRTTLSW